MTTIVIILVALFLAAVVFSVIKGVLDLCIKYYNANKYLKIQNEQLLKVIKTLCKGS
jgi:hypothetical protein